MEPAGTSCKNYEILGTALDESWQTFLRAHWDAIEGADFFTTEVWTWRGLVTDCRAIGFAVGSGSEGSSIMTRARRDEARGWIRRLGSTMGHYGLISRDRRMLPTSMHLTLSHAFSASAYLRGQH